MGCPNPSPISIDKWVNEEFPYLCKVFQEVNQRSVSLNDASKFIAFYSWRRLIEWWTLKDIEYDIRHSGTPASELPDGGICGAYKSNLPMLASNGSVFKLENDGRFTVKECTDFRLFHAYLNKEHIESVLSQRKELGFNMVRVLGTCHNMFRLYPSDFQEIYYDALIPFFNLCSKYNLYVEFTVFADATMAISDENQQIIHWNKVGNNLSKNVIIEVNNENDQQVNRLVSIQKLQPFSGIICSHGSNGSQAIPVRPWWNYETWHTNDAYEWWRKVGHGAMELSDHSHVPCIANENTRPDRDVHKNHFYDAAASAALLCAGSCFHCEDGKYSRLFTGQNLEFAQTWIEGINSVPLEFQDGMYIRRDDLLESSLLRVYEKRLSDGRGHIVKIRN